MTNDTHRSQLSLVAVIGFIVLGAWLFLLRVAGDWQLISPFTENMLAFVSGVGMLSAVALRFGRGGTSQTIRVTFFLLIMSASAELFLNFSSHVSAWDQLPVIGRQSSARPIVKHLLFCCWAGGAFMLIYLLLRAAENTNKKLQASERWFRTIFESEPECVKLLDREGNLLDMNSAGLNLIEADSLDQVRGQCIYSVVAEEHRT